MLVSGRSVHLGRFSHMDPAVITIAHMDPPAGRMGRRYQDRVRLLVVPPGTSPEDARALMDRAGSGTASGTPAAMLSMGAPPSAAMT